MTPTLLPWLQFLRTLETYGNLGGACVVGTVTPSGKTWGMEVKTDSDVYVAAPVYSCNHRGSRFTAFAASCKNK